MCELTAKLGYYTLNGPNSLAARRWNLEQQAKNNLPKPDGETIQKPVEAAETVRPVQEAITPPATN